MDQIAPALIAEITADIRSVADDITLTDTQQFNQRANALDFLDFHIIDRLNSLPSIPELQYLKQQVEKLKNDLESLDTRLFEQLCEGIRSKIYRGKGFLDMIHQYAAFSVNGDRLIKQGYDNLDNFINGLLNNRTLPEATQTHDAEMVFYQQTPVRVIFELAAKAKLQANDVFIDIGSGLGHVPILMNLISGAKTKGIEFEPAYCKYAQNCATRLNLPQVEFIQTNAHNFDYTRANIFFMYTPFKGGLLQNVLKLLQVTTQQRNIRLFTYGPCSVEVVKQTWLVSLDGVVDDEYKLYEFKSNV